MNIQQAIKEARKGAIICRESKDIEFDSYTVKHDKHTSREYFCPLYIDWCYSGDDDKLMPTICAGSVEYSGFEELYIDDIVADDWRVVSRKEYLECYEDY